MQVQVDRRVIRVDSLVERERDLGLPQVKLHWGPCHNLTPFSQNEEGNLALGALLSLHKSTSKASSDLHHGQNQVTEPHPTQTTKLSSK